MIGRLWARLRRMLVSDTGRVTLATGAAQALKIGTLVLMAWLYSQDDIGTYSVFLSYAAMLLMVNLFAYDWSIPNLEDGRPLRDMLVLLVLIAVTTASLSAGLLGLAGYGHPLALGVHVLGQSLIVVCDQLSVRARRYNPLIAGRVAPPLVLLALVLAMAYALPRTSAEVLIWSHAGGVVLTAVLYGVVVLWPRVAAPVEGGLPGPAALWALARDQRQFSTWMLPAQLLTRAAYEVPTLVLHEWFSPAIAAQYAMSLRVCRTPVNTFSQAIARIYHGELAETVREGRSGGMVRYRRVLRRLGIGGVLTVVACAGVLWWAVPMLLGAWKGDWWLLGHIVLIMAPLYGAIFAISPLTVAFLVFEEQRSMFEYSLAFFGISVVSFGYAAWSGQLLVGIAIFTWLSVLRYGWIAWRADRAHRAHLGPLEAGGAA